MHPWHTPQAHIHPLLNGESGRVELVLDLSASAPRPLYPGRVSRTAGVTLSAAHPGSLVQTATFPSTTRMNITCSALHPFIEDWTIRLDPRRQISVDDVIKGIHASLQTKITHLEWARMSESATLEISRAYTRRCRSAGAFRNAEAFELNQGVRRVDFLGDKYYFGGLTRARQDRPDDVVNLKLLIKGR